MPIFEYRCTDCGHVSEFIILGAAEGLNCKACNSPKLEKLISAHNTMASGSNNFSGTPGGCCGAPNSCGTPGSCCSG
jgi:putative FmdB family regulatory protein